MENPSTTAELRSAEQERAYRAGKKVVNRELLKSFVFIRFCARAGGHGRDSAREGS